ncbi:MAG: hypothetical protein K9I85_06030 [Saprospiraceae bacterium]|nr:hypothetical protein [Saprospiraceae bacterium]
MAYVNAFGTDRTASGGGGQTLAWQQDRDTVADYSVDDTVLTLTQTPVDADAIILTLNNGQLTYGVDWTLDGLDVKIQFDKAPDGQDHYFTANYPYTV